ncbi:MAG: tripartite tricarboxylate transporter substrate binding protein [Rhizobiales bacterium]|nr:tripartite tricarboxylate transporter substrate binding protein [Hyphomicrobiales bacterium]
MIKIVLRILYIGVVVLGTTAAHAQDFPSKPIRLIVPFPPGGPNDTIARVVGQKMSELLKQQVVIDNRGGAGGVVGTDVVATAPPDGHTIAITSAGALAISIGVQEKLPYDTLKHLKPVTLVAKVPELLVAATSLPASNLKELIALARAKPGALNYASSGAGSMPHLAGELLKAAAKIDIVHVPYKGAAPAVNDLLGQQVQMAFFDLPVLLPQVQTGKLKAIVVGSRERAASLKGVPTTFELGYPQVEADNWYGMVAPIATPPAVIARLHQVTVAALRDPGVREKLSSQGLNLVGDTPEEFSAYIRSEIEKWGKVAKAAGLAPN